MHLKKCKLQVWHPMTADLFGAIPMATGLNNYLMRVGLNNYLVCVGQEDYTCEISQDKTLETHVKK